MTNPKIKISKLRDIGWSLWDPLELLPEGEAWGSEENLAFADQYDDHLLQAAGKIRSGATPQEVVDYLLDIQRNTLGVNINANTKKRTQDTVNAIAASKDLWGD